MPLTNKPKNPAIAMRTICWGSIDVEVFGGRVGGAIVSKVARKMKLIHIAHQKRKSRK